MREKNFKLMLREGRMKVPPLEIRFLTVDPKSGADAIIDVAWRGQSCSFVAELKSNAKPLTLKLAIEQVREYAGASESNRPMLIAPYFSQEKLDLLLNAGISAIDFSGNAAIEVPGKFLFYKTGNRNQYPENNPIRSAYRGDGSLVARVLLLEPQFKAIGDILKAIRSRGGKLTLSMVSKVLQRLEADLVIERPTRNVVQVIQPERLLDGLLESYQQPKTQATWMGKVAVPPDKLLARLQAITKEAGVVRTGEGSAAEYAAWAGEPLLACYCRTTPRWLLDRLDAKTEETRAFANLRLVQTDNQLVYFDARTNLAASPIQSWLEMASGDKRQKETAEQIRNGILNATKAAK